MTINEKKILTNKVNSLSKMIFTASSVVNYKIDQCFACVSLSDMGLPAYKVNVYIGMDHKKQFIDIILVKDTVTGDDRLFANRVYAEDFEDSKPVGKIKTQFYCDDIRVACRNTIRFAMRRETA